jgi:hypothetical protein
MKANSLLQKFISILMLFIIMIEFTGCYSTKILTTSEINSSDIYLIHGTKVSYPVNNVTISDSILSANFDAGNKTYGSAIKNQIYLSSDSAINFDNYLITVPIDKIVKIEQKVPDQKKTRTLKTVLIVTGCVGVVTVVSAIIIANSINRAADQTATECSNNINDLINGGSNSSTGLCSNW